MTIFARVDEPQSCRYVLTVHTARTCQHPLLRPPSTAKPQDIVCQPALSAQQYMDYVKAQVCKYASFYFFLPSGPCHLVKNILGNISNTPSLLRCELGLSIDSIF